MAPYVDFDRSSWARLRAATPLTLGERDLAELQGISERVSLDEVETIYLPVSRLLNLHVAATQQLHETTDTFLGSPPARIPYVIGIAGSVAVGKSTVARILQALLRRWPAHPRVDLVTTDGFLLPLGALESRGILNRKGFPESYDVRRLIDFMADVKTAAGPVRAPVYSHQTYDIVPGEFQVVDRPDIVIVEGLNVLQRAPRALTDMDASPPERVFVSDFFDFSIYIDADEGDIECMVRGALPQAARDRLPRSRIVLPSLQPCSTTAEAVETAREIWRTINGVNLRENIQPTRDQARLILEKGRPASGAAGEAQTHLKSAPEG